jgi:hypothetical protein
MSLLESFIDKKALQKYKRALKHLEIAEELLVEAGIDEFKDITEKIDKLRKDLEKRLGAVKKGRKPKVLKVLEG